ncbi:MAG TPA: amidohydrolase [Chryseolinea sp.]|nr:amidohydrolase [Chryseolinea sp.]
MEIIERIKLLAASRRESCVGWRRHLHANPELSYCEFKTASFIHELLQSLGFQNVSLVGGTGVLTIIEGRSPGKTIMLRADIDALAIKEDTSLEFASSVPGVMHACGHDAHTAMLLAAADILLTLRNEWTGTIKILFQPAEEISPGGALKMIAAGVLESPKVQEAIGQHVMPRLPAGKVGIRGGRFMASADDFTITIHGRGGHAAMPDLTIDPVLIAGHLIVALQQVISRNVDPKIPAVLSIGRIVADGTYNVIPDQVILQGTFRTLDNDWRERGLVKIKKLAMELSSSMGADCTVEIRRGYPFLQNNVMLANELKASLITYLGPENVMDEDVWMAAEDFAHYSHTVPAVFYLLGVRNEAKGITSGLHTPTFTVDEDALPLGAGIMAWLAYQRMQP